MRGGTFVRVFAARSRIGSALCALVGLAGTFVAAAPPAAANVADECRAGNPAGAAILGQVAPMVTAYLGTHPSAITPGVSLAIVGPSPGDPSTPTIAIVNCGVTSEGGSDPVTSDTLFEAGSETKTFTATALARLVLAGTLTLDDAVQAFVPSPYVVPDHACGQPISTMTLRDLATHNGGFQDLPANRTWNEATNPQGRANYTRTDLRDSFASGWIQPCDALLFSPGAGYSYSDWGFALLGTILADAYAPNPGGVPNYAQLVHDLVTGPLGMADTVLEPIPPAAGIASPTCAPAAATPCAFDNVNAFAGAGGLVSDIGDMATFVAANLGFAPDPLLWPALRLTHQPAGIGAACAACQGLAWAITPPTAPNALSAYEVLDKDGGTNGMHSHTYLIPDACWGVTILSNSNEPTVVGSHGIAGAIIRALAPTTGCPASPQVVSPKFAG